MNQLSPEQRAELVAAVRQKMLARGEFEQKYGLARAPQMVGPQGGKMVMIGGRIYRQAQEGSYNLLNVFHDCALEHFGELRLEQEEAKPFDEMHPAVQWMHALVDALEQDRIRATRTQIGWGASWLRFGYDLFTVRDNAELMKKLSKELLDAGTFQSARFELKVAAIALSAGFKTAFEDETKNGSRHPEFVAIDQRGEGRIAVEAKSRRRNGVLGFRGGHAQVPGASVGVRSLLVDAFGKTSDLPFYVCVDLNLPPCTSEQQHEWIREIHQTINDLATEGYLDDEHIHGMLFVNDPSHYVGPRELNAQTDSLWVLPVKLREHSCAGVAMDVLDRLLEAHHQRVIPPSEVPT